MTSAEQENSSTESVWDLIERQFGLITTKQADEHGIGPSAISRRLESGEWTRVLPSVYRITAAPVTRRQRALGAALWAGDNALVSHAAAAVLWKFDRVRSQKVELWVPAERRLRTSSVIVHRGARLDRADRTTFEGIPITTPTRTLIDMSGRLEDHRLLAIAEDLLRRDVVRADRLESRLRALRRSGRPGAGRLEVLLDQRGDGRPLESALEALVWQIILETGIRLPTRQHWVTVTQGRYRLDFAWPDLKLGLECEGFAHHGGIAAWGKDRTRFAELAAIGWRVLPVTWNACTRERQRVVRWLTMAVPNAA
jgi:very-short-patch-repair endonuclease